MALTTGVFLVDKVSAQRVRSISAEMNARGGEGYCRWADTGRYIHMYAGQVGRFGERFVKESVAKVAKGTTLYVSLTLISLYVVEADIEVCGRCIAQVDERAVAPAVCMLAV